MWWLRESTIYEERNQYHAHKYVRKIMNYILSRLEISLRDFEVVLLISYQTLTNISNAIHTNKISQNFKNLSYTITL